MPGCILDLGAGGKRVGAGFALLQLIRKKAPDDRFRRVAVV